APCLAQFVASGDQRHRAYCRLAARRRGHRRKRLQLSGPGAACRRCRLRPRPSLGAGDRATPRRDLYRHQSRRRSPRTLPQPSLAHASGMTAIAVMRDLVSRPSGAIGVGIVLFHIIIAIIGPAIAPYDFAHQDVDAILQAPSAAHWFGTDRLGRDVFTRTLLGGREAMIISTASTIVAMIWGAILGIVVALVGGRLDEIVMRCADALMSIPWILIVMIFVAALGTGTSALIPVLGFSYGLSVIYLARSAALDFVTRDFVLAAKARGERRRTIILKELLPN